jgi:hypothetical protein
MSVHQDMSRIRSYEDGEKRPLWQEACLLMMESLFLSFFDYCDRMATCPGFLTHRRCEAVLAACRFFVDWWLAIKADFTDGSGVRSVKVEVNKEERWPSRLYAFFMNSLRNLDLRVLTPVDKWGKRAGKWVHEVIDFFRISPPASVTLIRKEEKTEQSSSQRVVNE